MDDSINRNNTNNNYKSSLTRNIGSGLTRSKLNAGAWRLSTGTTLTTPSRVNNSGLSLTPRRTPSERYQSVYSADRLGGGLRNASAPNLADLKPTAFDSTDSTIDGSQSQNDLDVGLNLANQSSERTKTSSVLTSSRRSEDTTSVQRRLDVKSNRITDRYNRYEKSRAAGNGEIVQKTDDIGVAVNIDKAAGKNLIKSELTADNDLKLGRNSSISRTNAGFNSYLQKSEISGSYVKPSYNLEDDEEDVTVRSSGNSGIQTSLKSSPRSDSGYNSPRVETNVDSGRPSVAHVRNDATEIGSHGDVTIGFSYHGNRRSLDLAGDQNQKVDIPNSSDKSKISQSEPEECRNSDNTRSPRKQRSNSYVSCKTNLETTPEVPFSVGSSEVIKSTKNPTTEVGQVTNMSAAYKNISQSERSRSSEGQDDTPVAKPRVKRRLTKRTISFKRVEDDEFIGFASLPEQVHRKAVRRGFEFTLMVVGETGLGKSTLINSLFLTDLYKDRKVGNIEERLQKTVDLEKKELEIEERGVKLKLTIVDTPGFNDAVNAEESWKPIVNYIDKQFEGYFKAESGLNRKNIQDTRVHCCLYFISPYGHGLRPVDVSVMKKLHHKVNIVPLIAKADMLTKTEVKRLKEKVLLEIEKHRIQIYQFPDCDSDEDEEFKQQDQNLKKSIPFAVVGSNTVVEAGGKKIRGRMYPWGIVEVENPLHCDFTKLRQMLISTHMQDLKDVTCDVHYENYRAEHITEQMSSGQKERSKLKRDSIASVEAVADTDKLLQEKEAEIKRMQDMLVKMQAQLQKNSPQMNGRVGHV